MKSFACILVFLVALTSCQLHKFLDVVYVVDEGLPKETIAWLNSSVMQLEERFTSSGIGDQINITNLYGLVLFGGIQQNVRKMLAGGTLELSTAAVFAGNLSADLNNLTSSNHSHDGYAGLYLALQTMWRTGSTRVIIFVSNRERDIVFANITRDMLVKKMVDVQVNLNAILNVSLAALVLNGPPLSNESANNNNNNMSISRYPAFGITYANTTFAYYTSPATQNIETTPYNAALDNDQTSSVVYDYVFLTELVNDKVYNLPIPSSVWQLNYTLNNNSADGQNFDAAFSNNKVFEIQNTNTIQVPCQACQGNNCYYLPNGLVSHTGASSICVSHGGQLASIDNDTELNAASAQYNDVFWINSYKSNSKDCLVVAGNNVTSVGCDELHFALCQIPRAPLIGC